MLEDGSSTSQYRYILTQYHQVALLMHHLQYYTIHQVIEELVAKLEATEEHHNIDKVTPWHRAFR